MCTAEKLPPGVNSRRPLCLKWGKCIQQLTENICSYISNFQNVSNNSQKIYFCTFQNVTNFVLASGPRLHLDSSGLFRIFQYSLESSRILRDYSEFLETLSLSSKTYPPIRGLKVCKKHSFVMNLLINDGPHSRLMHSNMGQIKSSLSLCQIISSCFLQFCSGGKGNLQFLLAVVILH